MRSRCPRSPRSSAARRLTETLARRAGVTLVVLLAANGCTTTISGDGGDAPSADAGPRLDGLPDAPEFCPETPPETCDYFLSCGCDQSIGEKCAAGPQGPHCAIAGTNFEGEACSSDTQCAYALLCTSYAGTDQCLPYCDSLHSCPTYPTEQACFIRVNDNGGEQIGQVCGQVCTLLTQDCADPSQACYPSRTYMPRSDKGICLTAGEGVQEDSCETTNDCAAGFICINLSGGGAICARLCDRTAVPEADGGVAPTGCDGVLDCRFLTGHDRTGVCLPS